MDVSLKDAILGAKKRRSRCDLGVLCRHVLEIFVCFLALMAGGTVGCSFSSDDGRCRSGGIASTSVVVQCLLASGLGMGRC